jgi:23S rRNA (cytosine1962-C5)-methyltransferase
MPVARPPSIHLKPGREKSLQRRHPWVFAGAIDSVKGDPGDGETVEVFDAHGQFLALGAFSPASQIRVRVWSWQRSDVIGPDFFRDRIRRALDVRSLLAIDCQTDAYRLVHAESDGLPGLIVDRYGDSLVAQILSSGAERWRETLADLLLELTGAERVYERSDAEVRRLENLPERSCPVRGSAPPERIEISENELKFYVDVVQGHKTGHYLDQRNNRKRVRQLVSGRSVLDCFTYTGGFLVNAVAGGARAVTAVDVSADALSLAHQNLELNDLPLDTVELVEGDVFQVLRNYRDRRLKFDAVILDPPKFAPTAAHVEQAARGYKDINLLAFKLLNPGGLLFTFSCSGGIDAELFQKIVAGAAMDAGVETRVLERLFQGSDHPVALNFPEGAYLKGLVVFVE